MKRRRLPIPPRGEALQQLEELADSTVHLAEQIKATVAELRRQDTRGTEDHD